ncbi:hypothetical protein HanXRQr2_Chr05g0224991 [Helianthus annuus]|uniref:Uncharacterized protein n=1 Tax=Helianthus annuus TaxID=4232 RepID=A0A9K3J1Q7_HELAN|nr:hypothetical protein HanXRQr2_Chr05g0224991 [Helianthus annuus]
MLQSLSLYIQCPVSCECFFPIQYLIMSDSTGKFRLVLRESEIFTGFDNPTLSFNVLS